MRVDLLPEEFRVAAETRGAWMAHLSPKTLWVFFAILCVADLALFAASAVVFSPQQTRMQAKYLKLGPELKEVRGIKSEAARLQERSRLLMAATTRRFAWSRILEEISAQLPDSVWLESVRLEETQEGDKSVRKTASSADKKEKADKIKKPAAKKPESGSEKKSTSTGKTKKDLESKSAEGAPPRSVRLIVAGRSAGAGRQTASVSDFVRRLETAPSLSAVTRDWKVESIRGAADDKKDSTTPSDAYVFVISSSFGEAEAAGIRPKAIRKSERAR